MRAMTKRAERERLKNKREWKTEEQNGAEETNSERKGKPTGDRTS